MNKIIAAAAAVGIVTLVSALAVEKAKSVHLQKYGMLMASILDSENTLALQLLGPEERIVFAKRVKEDQEFYKLV